MWLVQVRMFRFMLMLLDCGIQNIIFFIVELQNFSVLVGFGMLVIIVVVFLVKMLSMVCCIGLIIRFVIDSSLKVIIGWKLFLSLFMCVCIVNRCLMGLVMLMGSISGIRLKWLFSCQVCFSGCRLMGIIVWIFLLVGFLFLFVRQCLMVFVVQDSSMLLMDVFSVLLMVFILFIIRLLFQVMVLLMLGLFLRWVGELLGINVNVVMLDVVWQLRWVIFSDECIGVLLFIIMFMFLDMFLFVRLMVLIVMLVMGCRKVFSSQLVLCVFLVFCGVCLGGVWLLLVMDSIMVISVMLLVMQWWMCMMSVLLLLFMFLMSWNCYSGCVGFSG